MKNRIIVAAAEEVQALVAKGNVSGVFSIEHPGAVAQGIGSPRLNGVPQEISTMWDVESAALTKDGIDYMIDHAPTRQQVEDGMAFIAGHIGKGDVIVHCYRGKARSAGVALGALALLHPEKTPEDLIGMLLEQRPQAAPNSLIVGFADDIANRGGKLLQAVLDHEGITARRKLANEGRERYVEKFPPHERPALKRSAPQP
jgi:predicted protein tyrosine phosphatase